MGERAECVMLNKGPFVVDAVKTLDDILSRMQAHQEKKRSKLRKLRIASDFGEKGHGGVSARRPSRDTVALKLSATHSAPGDRAS